MKPVDLYYKKAQKESKYESVQLLYFRDMAATRECTITSDHFTKKRTVYYTVRYSQLSNIQHWLTQMEN